MHYDIENLAALNLNLGIVASFFQLIRRYLYKISVIQSQFGVSHRF
jgi:hypothetical protein